MLFTTARFVQACDKDNYAQIWLNKGRAHKAQKFTCILSFPKFHFTSNV